MGHLAYRKAFLGFLSVIFALYAWLSIERPAYAEIPDVQGRYDNRAEHWAGTYRLVRHGTAVTLVLASQRSPVQHFARQQPQALFTVPKAFRPAQIVTWEVAGAQSVDAQGQTVAYAAQPRFDLQVMPDGAVRYVDNDKVDDVGYLARF